MLDRLPFMEHQTRDCARAKDHDTVPGVPRTLNFQDPEAVRAAHRRIAQTPALVRFCDGAFDDIDQPASRDALTTLLLYKRAHECGQRSPSIQESRENARATLAARLSPTGKEALLRMLDESAGNHEFAEYLARPDRLYLTGETCRRQGDANQRSGAYAQAAEDYETAGEAYRLVVGGNMRAAKAYTLAAEARMHAGELTLAAEAYKMAAGAYAQTRELGLAAQAYSMAAGAHQEAKQPQLAADAYLMVGEVCMMDAEALASVGWHDLAKGTYESAACAYETAAVVCRHAGLSARATEADKLAAHAYACAGQYTRAADSYMTVAAAYVEAELIEQATATYAMAAATYARAAAAYTDDGQHEQAAAASVSGAEAYTEMGWHEEAEQAYGMAAEAYRTAAKARMEAGQLEQAAHACRLAANAYTEASLPGPAARAWREAAEAHAMQGLPELASEARAHADLLDLRASQPRMSRAAVIHAVNTAIAAHLKALGDSDKGLVSRGIRLHMHNHRDFVSFDDFDPGANVAWCLVSASAEKKIYHFVTATSVFRLIKNTHPILRRPFEEGELLRGQDVLDLLSEARMDASDGAPTEEPALHRGDPSKSLG